MRISQISFKNFRCFKSDVIDLSDYTSFVGPNNCGKSTILRALNIFFGEGMRAGQLSPSDFSINSTEDKLSILIEFSDVNGAAADELAHYVRDGKLLFEIIGHRDDDDNIISKCRGIRYGLARLAPFFAGQKTGDRKPIYEQLINDGVPLPSWKNFDQAESDVQEYERAFSSDFVRIASEENAYGATGPLPKLKQFVEWIYVPAVKEASAEASEQRNSAFSKLVLFAIRSKVNLDERIGAIRTEASNSLTTLLSETQEVINAVGGEIDLEFSTLSTTPVNVALEWDDSQSISLKEPSIRSIFRDGQVFDSPENFGHGIQRTYIMALLSLAAKVQANVEDFQLILGIEEPELYQHPPQAKFLSSALSSLAKGNAQVLLTTHSPYFVTGRTFESIRTLRKKSNITNVHSWSVDQQKDYCAKRKNTAPIGADAALSGLDKTLHSSISEMFFATKLVLVEGPEDEAIFTAYMQATGVLTDFLKSGGHFVCVGGKTKMPMLIALARGFYIDVCCVFDFDMDKTSNNQGNDELRRYAKDLGINIPTELSDNFFESNFLAFRNDIQTSITDDFDGWPELLSVISKEWGWKLSSMKKDPMLLQEGIERAVNGGANLDSLKAATTSLRSFCLS